MNGRIDVPLNVERVLEVFHQVELKLLLNHKSSHIFQAMNVTNLQSPLKAIGFIVVVVRSRA